ncbi:pyridoxine biosynthesis protein [Xylographa opegraphella]|nr:pyridoxine biosynthesis protein [Xylographa opegraphella]
MVTLYRKGDSFSAGDVLLEIETDKPQMDVEAQDDGIVAKITVRTLCTTKKSDESLTRVINQQFDGAKGVKVGMRIAVLAEPEDDLSAISIPEDTSPSAPEHTQSSPAPMSSQEETKSGNDPAKSSESQAEVPQSSKSVNTSQTPESQSFSREQSPVNAKNQKYPLYPSVAQILHENGIPAAEADKISASGPKGRLLKGDVLAYLGTISASYPSEESARISRLEHLDLSSIKIATPPKAAPSPPLVMANLAPELDVDTEIAVSVSMKAVKEAQERIRNVLGIDIPVENFVARAIEVSNMDLPRSKLSQPTADQLFNQVLGLDHANLGLCQGRFTPQIVALPSVGLPIRKGPTKKPDIIDILTGQHSLGSRQNSSAPHSKSLTGSTAGSAVNVFSVSASKGEEQRAKIFLDRVKTVLQVNPGRLVL